MILPLAPGDGAEPALREQLVKHNYLTPCTVAWPHAPLAFDYECAVCGKLIEAVLASSQSAEKEKP